MVRVNTIMCLSYAGKSRVFTGAALSHIRCHVGSSIHYKRGHPFVCMHHNAVPCGSWHGRCYFLQSLACCCSASNTSNSRQYVTCKSAAHGGKCQQGLTEERSSCLPSAVWSLCHVTNFISQLLMTMQVGWRLGLRCSLTERQSDALSSCTSGQDSNLHGHEQLADKVGELRLHQDDHDGLPL